MPAISTAILSSTGIESCEIELWTTLNVGVNRNDWCDVGFGPEISVHCLLVASPYLPEIHIRSHCGYEFTKLLDR